MLAVAGFGYPELYRVKLIYSVEGESASYDAEAHMGAAYGFATFRAWGFTPKEAARKLADAVVLGAEAAANSPLAQLAKAAIVNA